MSEGIFLVVILLSAFIYGKKVKAGEKFKENGLSMLWGIFIGMLFLCLNIEIFSYFGQIKEPKLNAARFIFTTMMWTGFSYWLLLQGIFRNNYNLRIAGISLITITAAKLFFIDIHYVYNYSYGYPLLFNLKFLSLVFLLSIMAIGAKLYTRNASALQENERNAAAFLWCLFISSLFLGLNIETLSYFGHMDIFSSRIQSFVSITILWSVFSFFLFSLGIKKHLAPFRVSGLILATATFAAIIFTDAVILPGRIYSQPSLLHLKFASAVVLLFTLAYNAVLYAQTDIKKIDFEDKAVPYLWCLFLILLFVEIQSQATLSFRIWDIGEQKAAFAISSLWILYGLGLLLFGIIKKILPLRISALSLFGITLCKVFFVDLRFTGRLYKMFILLGIGSILLIAAYFYHRYRKNLDSEGNI